MIRIKTIFAYCSHKALLIIAITFYFEHVLVYVEMISSQWNIYMIYILETFTFSVGEVMSQTAYISGFVKVSGEAC